MGLESADLMEEAVLKRSIRALENEEAEKGGAGIPVNSCTIARKFDVSVVRTVVGALLDALDLFFGFLPAFGCPTFSDPCGSCIDGPTQLPLLLLMLILLFIVLFTEENGPWSDLREDDPISPPTLVQLGSDCWPLPQTASRLSRAFMLGVAGEREKASR